MEWLSGGLTRPLRGGWIRWGVFALLVCGYLMLPDGKADDLLHLDDDGDPDPVDAALRPEIWDVSPHDAYPGNSVVLEHSGAASASALRVYAGKREIALLARPTEHTVVARLPRDVRAGDLKLRVALGEPETPSFTRSKAYHIRVKNVNARKAMRQLAGGIALFVLGVSLLVRGVRRAASLDGARKLAAWADRRPLAFVSGSFLGLITQSTTATAGVFAALASSSVLAAVPAAVGFMGAQLGAAIAPVLITGLVEPREGLLAIALGVAAIGFATDRRATAMARLLLGLGFVAHGIQLFNHGFEPLLSDPALLASVQPLEAGSVSGRVACALVGALFVAGLQGPGPLVLLMLGAAQVTGQWDLQTSLAVLGGTGLGAAVASLTTTPAGGRSRQLAKLHLAMGALSSVLFTASVGLWTHVGDWATGLSLFDQLYGRGELRLGVGLFVGFASAQVACALLLAPLAPTLARLLARASSPNLSAVLSFSPGKSGTDKVLERALSGQRRALSQVLALVLEGERLAGRRAEQQLKGAREVLDRLAAVRPHPPHTPSAGRLHALTWTCLSLQRSLEALLAQAETVTDMRVSDALAQPDATAFSAENEALLRELDGLVSEGMVEVERHLASASPLDLEAALAREIRANGLEAQARRTLLEHTQAGPLRADDLHMLEIADAYEVVANHVYRITEILDSSSTAAYLASAS